MKIKFLIDNDPPTTAVSDWYDIEAKSMEGHITPSKDFYDAIKQAEKNKDLEKEIIKSRENARIQRNGLDWKDYYFNYFIKNIGTYDPKEQAIFNDFYVRLDREVTRINSVLKLDPHISNQLKYLIIGGFVFPVGFPISHEYIPSALDENGPYEGLYIYIHNKIKKDTLITYIENNWDGIESIINHLPERKSYYSSSRDMTILELKERGHTYKEIVDIINSDPKYSGLKPLSRKNAMSYVSKLRKKINTTAEQKGNK